MAAPTAVRPDAAEQATYVSPDTSRDVEVAALWSAIAELPQAQREALLLREIRGLSYDELAGYLAVIKAGGIAVGTMPLLRASELRKILVH